MFLIANAGRSEITLSDLGVVLLPNQAIDLHKVKTDMPPEKSKDLSLAARRGAIKILKRDEPVAPQPNITINEGVDKDELLSDLKSFIKEELSGIESPKNDNSELKELIELLKSQQQNNISMEQIQSLLAAQSLQGDSAALSPDVDVDIDESKIAEMHSKAVDKLAKNMRGEVDYSKQKVKDESISANADELEGLL